MVFTLHLKLQEILSPKNRIIPLSKTGEFLRLIPLFAGFSALDAFGEAAADIVKAVSYAKAAEASLKEPIKGIYSRRKKRKWYLFKTI